MVSYMVDSFVDQLLQFGRWNVLQLFRRLLDPFLEEAYELRSLASGGRTF
jgi:hypothetical protein